MSIQTPQMYLYQPTIGVDSGLTWEQQINANTTIIDGHNHSPGSGAPINSSGININSDLSLNGYNLVAIHSLNFNALLSPLSGGIYIGCLYVSGSDLYYNDTNGNQIQITAGGLVNATSSGISSGTATASFSGSTLVVNAASNTPANIQAASYIMGNTGVSGSHYVTLSPPTSLALNYSLTFPSLPAQTNVMTLGNDGTMASITYDAVGQAMTSVGANAIAASMTVTGANAIAVTMNNPNFSGKAAQEASKNLIVSNTNATNSLAMVRGGVNGANGAVIQGEGFTGVRNSTGVYTISYTTAFGDVAVVVASAQNSNGLLTLPYNQSSSGFMLNVYTNLGAVADSSFNFIAVGQRA